MNKVDTPVGLDVFFKEQTYKSYEKLVKVIKDGQELYANIDYDQWDGYGITWFNEDWQTIEEPAWATQYADATSYHELAYLLDELGQR